MMFNSLGIRLGIIGRNADGEKEFDDEPVPGPHPFGEFPTRLSKKNTAIRLTAHQFFAFETGYRLDDGRMGHPQAPGNIDLFWLRPRLPSDPR